MKYTVITYISIILFVSCLFSQLVEIDKLFSLSVEDIDLQRAYINSDNSMIAAESIVSPLQVFFFSRDNNFTKSQPLSRKKIPPGSKNHYKAFQFFWSPLDPAKYYYSTINNKTNAIEFWSGYFSINMKQLIKFSQINNNSMYASEFYPATFPSLKVIGIDNGFSEDDIWFLGFMDVYNDYFLYSSDERFTSRENRLFQNSDYIPLNFDVHFNPEKITSRNDGCQYTICIDSEAGGLDIIYYDNSNQLTQKYSDFHCTCAANEAMELKTSIGAHVTCSSCRRSYSWPENEKYIYVRNTNTYDNTVSDYVPKGEQFQPRFNHAGDKIAFINIRLDEKNNYELITFDIPKTKKYNPIEEQIDNIQDSSYYQIIDDNLYTNGTMDLPIWVATDFCWHPSKNILFYVKEVIVDEVVERHLLFYNIDDNKSGQLNTGTWRNAMPTISNDGEFLLFHHLGKGDNGDFHFDNCHNKGKGQTNINCCYATSDLKYKIGAAQLKY